MSVQKCILDMFIIQNCDIWVFNLKPSCQSLMNMSLGISINVYHTFKEICVAGYLMKGWFIFYSNCKIRHLLLWCTKFKASVTLYTFMLSVLWSNYELIQLNKCIPLFFFFLNDLSIENTSIILLVRVFIICLNPKISLVGTCKERKKVHLPPKEEKILPTKISKALLSAYSVGWLRFLCPKSTIFFIRLCSTMRKIK